MERMRVAGHGESLLHPLVHERTSSPLEPPPRYRFRMSERKAPYRVEREPVALMQCPVAGFQYHGGEACWGQIHANDRLALKREPGNRHDPRAIAVEWRNVMVGYVPREANYALSQMMDRGMRAEGRVCALRLGGDPWQRMMMEIVVHPIAPVSGDITDESPREIVTVFRGLWPKSFPDFDAVTPPRDGWMLSDADYDFGTLIFRECFKRLTY